MKLNQSGIDREEAGEKDRLSGCGMRSRFEPFGSLEWSVDSLEFSRMKIEDANVCPFRSDR